MERFDSFFSLMIFLCGIYCLYQAISLCVTGRMPRNCIILSKEHSMDSCLDPDGYAAYMKPRFLIFSILLVLFTGITMLNSITGFLNTLVAPLSATWQMVIIQAFAFVLPLAVLIWFSVILIRAQKEYW